MEFSNWDRLIFMMSFFIFMNWIVRLTGAILNAVF